MRRMPFSSPARGGTALIAIIAAVLVIVHFTNHGAAATTRPSSCTMQMQGEDAAARVSSSQAGAGTECAELVRSLAKEGELWDWRNRAPALSSSTDRAICSVHSGAFTVKVLDDEQAMFGTELCEGLVGQGWSETHG